MRGHLIAQRTCRYIPSHIMNVTPSPQAASSTEPTLDSSADSVGLSRVLREKFELGSFRLGQEEIIQNLLDGRDTLAVMPTGGGKSLCYQLPTIVRGGLTLVVSPLIALMRDQVRELQERKIPTGALYSGQNIDEKRKIFKAIASEKQFVLYLSPERIQKEGFRPWFEKQDIKLIAVDEAHCVSQWGPDFRTDYSKLSLLRQWRSDIPIIALTATATPMVLDDIAEQLGIQQANRYVRGFFRPNLYYQIAQISKKADKLALVKKALSLTPEGRVVIYAGTRKNCEALSADLASDFKGVGFYHAGLSGEKRQIVEKSFATNKKRILVATNAFGMGMNFPDIRLVLHYQMPGSVEAYYQEVGRAGRDGQPSVCLTLYSGADQRLQNYFIDTSQAEPKALQRRRESLDHLIAYLEGSSSCRHASILRYFRDAQTIQNCGTCDYCSPKSRLPLDRIRGRSTSSDTTSDMSVLSNDALAAYHHLKRWRNEYAKKRDVPAFVIFSDRTLRELAKQLPSSEDDLHRIHGFGPRKVEKYGPDILAEIRDL